MSRAAGGGARSRHEENAKNCEKSRRPPRSSTYGRGTGPSKGATALKVQLRTAGEVPRGAASAASLEAFQLYLRGRQLVQLRMEPNLRQAIGLLERSIELDPLNAMAHAELASAYALTVHYYRQVDGQFLRLATERAHQALRLDPNLSLPHAVLGTVAMSRQQWREAERSYRRAIELSANDAQARYWLGELYMVMGRSHAALETIYEAFTLDPILAPLVMDISTLHLHSGNLAEACRFAERTTKLTANGYAWLGWARCLRSSGDVAGAERAEARAEQNFGFERPVFSLVHAALRDRTRKPAALAAIAAEYARQSAQFQLELIALEEYDAVFDALESNLARFNYNGLRDLWATESRGLRAQPRFRELAMDHGMLDFWRTSGWPDVCRPAGDSFTCD